MGDETMTSRALLAAAYRAIPLGHEVQAWHQPGGWVAEVAGMRLAHYSPGENRLAALGGQTAEQVLATGAQRFGGEPFRVVVDAVTGKDLAAALAVRGRQAAGQVQAMALAPVSVTVPDSPPELDIHLVSDAAGLEDWFTAAWPGARAPQDPPEVDYNRRFLPPSVLSDPAVALLVGSVDGRPVASSAAYLAGDVADIGAVATWPDARRRGYGTAMTWAAVAEGARRGATAAALQPTTMGYPVYARMGFVPVCTFLVLE